MKKIICLCLTLAMMTAVFSGCQQTPEAPIVVGKDNSLMIETAKATPAPEAADMTLAERYGIPSELEFALTGAEGKLNITVDAAIDAPENPFPILRVRAAEFEQETVSRFWKVLVGDTPMFELDSRQTKADIEESILYYKQVQAGALDSVVEPEEAQAYIDELEEQYKTAPESVKKIPADGTLRQKSKRVGDNPDAARYYGVSATNADDTDFSMAFRVENNPDNGKPIISIHYDDEGNEIGSSVLPVWRAAQITWSKDDAPGARCGGAGELLSWQTDSLPREAEDILNMTPVGAADRVEVLLSDLGLADLFAVSGIYLIDNSDASLGVDGGVIEPTAYAYSVECSRVVLGSLCAESRYSSGSGGSSGDIYSPAPYWAYEHFEVELDDSGIFSVNWGSPLSIEEVVAEETALLPFSEVEDILNKMLLVMYEPEAKSEYLHGLDIHIDRAALRLWRIAEQGTFDTGLLVPVWNFYGTYTEKGDGYTNTQNRMLMTINAIDGSIIDPDLGY